MVKVYATSDHELLVTEDNGRILEVKDFLLSQPEVSKFRWKDTDFTKTPTPTPEPTAKPKAKKKASPSKQKAAAASESEEEL
jgi:hypothetical protein